MTVNLTFSNLTFARLEKDEKVWPQNGLKLGQLLLSSAP